MAGRLARALARWSRRLARGSHRLARGSRGAAEPDPLRAACETLRASGLFDAGHYRGQLPPDALAGEDPLRHYLRTGAARGLDPHPLFDAAWYGTRHPEVRAAGWPALLHYVCEGEAGGLRPNPLFDPLWYAERHAGVSAGGGRALAHYAAHGAARGDAPDPLLDPAWYAARAGGLSPGGDALAHWRAVGARAGIDPHPLFDGTWYLARHPGVARAAAEPVAHWVATGAVGGLSPHPLLDAAWYTARHPEAAGDPLRHWIEVGAQKGFAPHPLFAAAWYRARHPNVERRGDDPLRHYVTEGAARDLLPHPLFDPVWYRAQHPELGGPGVAALAHCAERGEEPGPLFASFARFFLPDADHPELAGPANPLAPFLAGGAARYGTPPRLAFAAPEAPEAPEATVVIPAWGQPLHTIACLRSLAAARGETPFEVILVDDASPDVDYRERLGAVPGLRILRNEHNLGFVGTCNRGAAAARGRRLVFLNNDTVVTDGWLDALLATFETFPDAGVAGSKLLFPSGRTAEAGAIVWRDGSCWNYGRRHPPDGPEVEYAREVDYVSGAALAVERALFESLGGFDPAFAPGYYEDVDLAWRVRAAGRRVVYQPTSHVIHFEGVSSAGDPGAGMKAHQTAHRRVFVERWGATLEGHREVDPAVLDLEKDRFARGRALVIDTVLPTPGRDARSARTLQLLRILRDLGLQPSFLPANGNAPEPWRRTLRAHGVRVLTPPWVGSPEAFVAGSAETFDACVVCRPALAARLLPALRARWPAARILFDAADLLPPAALPTLREGSAGPAAARAAKHADATLFAADPEAWKPEDPDRDDLVLLPWIFETRRPAAPRAARRDLLLLVGLQAAPAVDALLWLRDEILPRAARELPELRAFVPAWPALRPLLAGDARLQPLGDEALEAPRLFDRFCLGIAPLRLGGGVAGRLAPALAAGLPCVATARAAHGLSAPLREALVSAADAETLAREIVRLHVDASAWEAAAGAGAAAGEALFAYESARERLRRVLTGGPR